MSFPLFLLSVAACPQGGPSPSDSSLACGADAQCVELPGWNGPVAVRRAASSDPAPTCDGYPRDVFTGTSDLSAPPATCGCGCGEPTTPVTCPATATLEQFDSNIMNCLAQAPASTQEITEGCTDLPYFDDASFKLEIEPLDLSGVTCETQATTEVVPPTWGTTAVG